MCWESLSRKFCQDPNLSMSPIFINETSENHQLYCSDKVIVSSPWERGLTQTCLLTPRHRCLASERVTAWKAERRSLKRIKIGLIAKLGTVPVLFVLIHARFINIEWWLLFSKVLNTYSFCQSEREVCILDVHSFRKSPRTVCCLILPFPGTVWQRFSTALFG